MERLIYIGLTMVLLGNYIKTTSVLNDTRKQVKELEVEVENLTYERDQCRVMWRLGK